MTGCLLCAFRHVLKSKGVNDLEGFLDKSGWLLGPVILEPGCTLVSTGELGEMLVPGSFPRDFDFIGLLWASGISKATPLSDPMTLRGSQGSKPH